MKNNFRGIAVITDFILSQFPEAYSLPQGQRAQRLSFMIQQFLHGEVSFEECCRSTVVLAGTSAPIEKLQNIMNIGDTPISPDSGGEDIPRKKSRCWSSYEDERLLAGILKFGAENWTSISLYVGNSRTRSQCSQRWFRGLDPRLSKEQWTISEEAHLMQLVSYYGDKSWTQIALKMGNRSDVQCRYRYKQLQKDRVIHNRQSGNPSPPPAGIRKAASTTLPQMDFPPPEMGGNPFEAPDVFATPPPQKIPCPAPLPVTISHGLRQPSFTMSNRGFFAGYGGMGMPQMPSPQNWPLMSISLSTSALPPFQPLSEMEVEDANDAQRARFQETLALFSDERIDDTGEQDEDVFQMNF